MNLHLCSNVLVTLLKNHELKITFLQETQFDCVIKIFSAGRTKDLGGPNLARVTYSAHFCSKTCLVIIVSMVVENNTEFL